MIIKYDNTLDSQMIQLANHLEQFNSNAIMLNN